MGIQREEEAGSGGIEPRGARSGDARVVRDAARSARPDRGARRARGPPPSVSPALGAALAAGGARRRPSRRRRPASAPRASDAVTRALIERSAPRGGRLRCAFFAANMNFSPGARRARRGRGRRARPVLRAHGAAPAASRSSKTSAPSPSPRRRARRGAPRQPLDAGRPPRSPARRVNMTRSRLQRGNTAAQNGCAAATTAACAARAAAVAAGAPSAASAPRARRRPRRRRPSASALQIRGRKNAASRRAPRSGQSAAQVSPSKPSTARCGRGADRSRAAPAAAPPAAAPPRRRPRAAVAPRPTPRRRRPAAAPRAAPGPRARARVPAPALGAEAGRGRRGRRGGGGRPAVPAFAWSCGARARPAPSPRFWRGLGGHRGELFGEISGGRVTDRRHFRAVVGQAGANCS